MAKRGRKRIEIDWKVFEGLCAIQATLREMAVFFDCCEDTVQNAVKRHYHENFSVIFAQKRLKGFISLRRQMWEKALGGSTALQIFLAKQYLGMADQMVVNGIGSPVPAEPEGDLSRLSDEQLDQLEQLINVAHGEAPSPKPKAAKAAPAAEQTTPDSVREALPPTPPVNPKDQT